jgi:pyridoxamine 5'-phosphate oxidase
MDLADMRREYQAGGLRRADLDANPIAQFQKWFAQAEPILRAKKLDANAATLATADQDGRPSARIILLKGLDKRGFIFFTNYGSRKGLELSANPHAALNFFWAELERQISISGTVERVSRADSERYFHTRPRNSQLAALGSDQSTIVKDREALEARFRELEEKFPGEIPLPPNWGGYALNPVRLEFWQGRPSRLHDRFAYTRQADGQWKIERLSP